jgi:hypothetical protein
MSGWIWSQSDLMKLAEHRKPKVRRWACERLRTLYGERGVGVLERLLKDEDKDVLLEALEYLENHPDPKFKDTLLRIYETKTGIIAGKSALLLGKLKDERLIAAYRRKISGKSVGFDEIISTIRAMGELTTAPARAILRQMLSEMEEEVDPFFINALIHALIKAGEDFSALLECYVHHYKDRALEILHPLTTVCGSWYSPADLEKEGRNKLLGRSIPFVVSESFSYLKEKGLTSLEETLRKAFKKKDYRQVIAIAWEHVKKTAEENGYQESEILALRGDSPPLVNSRTLRAFKDFAISGPEDSLRNVAVAALPDAL